MKYYKVKVQIPVIVEKNIYIDDATSITDAKKKAKAWGKNEYDPYSVGGDEELGQCPSKLKIISVEEDK